MGELLTKPVCERLLAESVEDVLETMFFTCRAEELPEDAGADPGPVVEIRFRGNPPGVFHQRLGRRAAAELAASFLGAASPEEVTQAELENVLRELANVICGRALSRIESDSTFALSSPEILAEAAPVTENCSAHCLIPLETGQIEVWLALEAPR